MNRLVKGAAVVGTIIWIEFTIFNPDVTDAEAKPKADAKWDGPSGLPTMDTDGDGSLTIWRIQNFKKVPLPSADYGVYVEC